MMQAREDWCLIRIVEIGHNPSGIAIPQFSVEGKRFEVVSVGDKVSNLKPGDNVLMTGRPNVNYFQVPNTSDLIVIKQEFVVLVVTEDALPDSELTPEQRAIRHEQRDMRLFCEGLKSTTMPFTSNND